MSNCENCGSGRHTSDKCPTLNLVKYLTGETVDESVPLPETLYMIEADSVEEIAEGVKKLHKWKVEGRCQTDLTAPMNNIFLSSDLV